MDNKQVQQEQLRKIPKVDKLLQLEQGQELCGRFSPALAAQAIRQSIDSLRAAILRGEEASLCEGEILRGAQQRLEEEQNPSLRRVINATGVVLHTNLGRAAMAQEAARAAMQVAGSYNTLEYSLQTGSRGSRHDHVESLICQITGAEAAMAVNNNAAAVMLMLSALAKGKEVVVSRGELVEIGGSFRVPEIMEQSGAVLQEVGTTNKTRAADYERAIGENTAALLKVHPSNFRISGFCEEATLEELKPIARSHGIPLLYDIGSGLLASPERMGLPEEPSVQRSLAAGADVICFSGDKLLGGPQAGILAGNKELIAAMKKHPLARALRLDKMTLAALEATLRLYQDPEQALKKVPTLAMICATPAELNEKAQRIYGMLSGRARELAKIQPEQGQVGGGSVPGHNLPGMALCIEGGAYSPDVLEEKLRGQKLPIIARIAHDQLILDMRTVLAGDEEPIARSLNELLNGEEA